MLTKWKILGRQHDKGPWLKINVTMVGIIVPFLILLRDSHLLAGSVDDIATSGSKIRSCCGGGIVGSQSMVEGEHYILPIDNRESCQACGSIGCTVDGKFNIR